MPLRASMRNVRPLGKKKNHSAGKQPVNISAEITLLVLHFQKCNISKEIRNEALLFNDFLNTHFFVPQHFYDIGPGW